MNILTVNEIKECLLIGLDYLAIEEKAINTVNNRLREVLEETKTDLFMLTNPIAHIKTIDIKKPLKFNTCNPHNRNRRY
jgi:hypothetical protein